MVQIKTRRDYHLAMAEIEVYLAKGFDNLTEPEEHELERLSKKVQQYEQVYFPIPLTYDLKNKPGGI